MSEGAVERPCTWQDVPGYFDFNDLYFEMVSKAPASGSRFVEIGVLFGRSTMFMANEIKRSGKQITFDAIDRYAHDRLTWTTEFDSLVAKMSPERAAVARRAVASATLLNEVPFYFVLKAGLYHHVNLICGLAQEQARLYEDASLDFVFLDDDHQYRETKELILAYLPKIKVGGTIAGHDFTITWPGVIRAVNEVFGRNRRIRKNCWVHVRES
jgi:predicted O-methyltransferase YrrM